MQYVVEREKLGPAHIVRVAPPFRDGNRWAVKSTPEGGARYVLCCQMFLSEKWIRVSDDINDHQSIVDN